jgi:hypothetical protein
MKTIQIIVREIKTTMPWGRGVGLLVLCLIVGILLVACGVGLTPPDQATNVQAASESDAASQASEPSEDSAASQASEPDADSAASSDVKPFPKEFGLTDEELVEKIEAVEPLIAECMNEAGFEYVPVDYLTVRKAMTSDKSAPGLNDEEYAAQFGFGISTRLDVAGLPPQLATDTIIQIGLGEQNIQIFNNLSEADQEAYNHTLFGEDTHATFAFTLEDEDFSETGGCTRAAIEQVFTPEQMEASFYNPGDALVEQDPRVIAAIADWAACMREEGFDYNSPEEVEGDIEDRLDAILDGAEPAELSPDAQAALTELQGEERAIAVAVLACEEEFITPAVEQVQTELYGSPQQ